MNLDPPEGMEIRSNCAEVDWHRLTAYVGCHHERVPRYSEKSRVSALKVLPCF